MFKDDSDNSTVVEKSPRRKKKEQKIVSLGRVQSIRNRPQTQFGSVDHPFICIREYMDNIYDVASRGEGATKALCFHGMVDPKTDKIDLSIKLNSQRAKKLIHRTFIADDGLGVPLSITHSPEEGNVISAWAIYNLTYAGSNFNNLECSHKTKVDYDNFNFTAGLNGVGSVGGNFLSSNFKAYINIQKKLDLGLTVAPSIRRRFKKDKSKVWYCMNNELGESVGDSLISHETFLEEIPEYWHTFDTADFGTVLRYEEDPTIWTSVIPKVDLETPRLSRAMVEKKTGSDFHIQFNKEIIPAFNIRETAFPEVVFEGDTTHAVEVVTHKDFVNPTGAECRTIVKLSCEFGWSTQGWGASAYSASNGILTKSDGLHVKMAYLGIGKFMANRHDVLTPEDGRSGLRVFVLALSNGTNYTSQTKEKVNKFDGFNTVKDNRVLPDLICEQLETRYKDDKAFGRYIDQITDMLVDYKVKSGQVSLQQAVSEKIPTSVKGKKGAKIGSKFYDCSTQKRMNAEVFLVEGDSAMGTMLDMRNAATQAIMTGKGKPPNVTTKLLAEIIDEVDGNPEVVEMVRRFGCGVKGINFDYSALRYGDINFCTDADADGQNIVALWAGILMEYTPELFANNNVRWILTPLYMQNGLGIFAESDLDRKLPFSRFKGLGSLTPEATTEFILDKNTRYHVRINGENLDKALALVRYTEERKKLVQDAGLVRVEDPETIGQILDDGIKKYALASVGKLPIKSDRSFWIKEISVFQLITHCYLEYAEYANRFRLIPKLEDGMIPVYRRVLMSARQYLKKTPTISIVATTMMKYHPHGDANINPVVSRLIRYGLIKGEGNHGKFSALEETKEAATRYTKAYTNSSMHDYLYRLVDYSEWYENDLGVREPMSLITPIPLMLLFGHKAGIGVGTSTEIPPFTYNSLLAAWQADDPDLLEAPYGLKLDRDKTDLDNLWNKGEGDYCVSLKCHQEFSEEYNCMISVITGKTDFFRIVIPQRFIDLELEEKIFMNDETSKGVVRFVVGRQNNIRVTSDDEIFEIAKELAVYQKKQNIKVVSPKGIVIKVGIKNWLDFTINRYLAAYERWKLDQTLTLRKSIFIYQILPFVVEQLTLEKTNSEIIDLVQNQLILFDNKIGSAEIDKVIQLKGQGFDFERFEVPFSDKELATTLNKSVSYLRGKDWNFKIEKLRTEIQAITQLDGRRSIRESAKHFNH